MSKTAALQGYTVVLLRCADRYLLLQRSQAKTFAPGLWTGIGGHVESNEYVDLHASALRELQEESGLLLTDIEGFALRRVLLTNRPGRPFGVLFFFTGTLTQAVLPDCPEGDLSWKHADEFAALDIIDNTRAVLDCLVEDMQRDPSGIQPPRTGLGVFAPDGRFQQVIWG